MKKDSPLNKRLFRFKTEQEFIEEFGESWKSRIKCYWCEEAGMDHFFNTIIMKKYNIEFLKLWIALEDSLRYKNWVISKDMIKLINNEDIR